MKKLKKIVAVAIAATMITSAGQASLTAIAAEVNSSVAADEAAYNGTCGDNLTYDFDQATSTLIISGTGAMTNYSYFNPYLSPWDAFKDSIVNVTIEDGVESIGAYAFYKCSAIKSVNIASSVKSIEQCAFSNCTSLESIDIPSSVKTIGEGSFGNCKSLSSVNLADGIERIEGGAFEDCNSLNTVEIPDSVIYIDSSVFAKYDGSNTVLRCSKGGPAYLCAIDENSCVEFEWNGKYFKNSGKCGDDVSFNFDAETGTLVISGTGEMYDYEMSYSGTVSDVPFFNYAKSIKKIVIEDGVTGLGMWTAFCAENVEEIHFPASVKKIPAYSLPDSSKKNHMIYADEGTYAYEYAIENWYCINGKIQGKCGDDAHYTFDKETGLLTISGTGWLNYYDIGFSPWELSGWSSLIKNVVIEEGITGLGGNGTFANCPNIKSLNIPASVTDLSGLINYGDLQEPLCFESINVSEENPDFSSFDGVLFNKDKTELIFYPANKPVENYNVPETVETIGISAFSGSKKLVSINIPDSVTSIVWNAFGGCTSLKNVVLSSGITFIEQHMFSNCTALENIIIPYGVKSINNGAFEHCTSLKNVEIPDSVTSVYDEAFEYCTSLESVVIPNSVTSIGDYAFYCCTSLKSVVIPKTLEKLEDGAFLECTSLSDAFILNNNVKLYGYYIFPKTTTIYGRISSTASTYAKSSGNEFVVIPYVQGYNVSISGNIGLGYHIDTNGIDLDTNDLIKFCYDDGTVISEIEVNQANQANYGTYTCPVSASKMGKEIRTYYVVNGFEICISEDYGVQEYAETLIENIGSDPQYAKSANVAKAMLNYGAYSEIALTDVTLSTINSSLTDEEKTLAELPDLSKYRYAVSGASDKVKYSGSLISLKTETVIRHYFKVAEGVNAEKLTFTVDGETVTPVKDGRYYRIDIAGVNAKNLDKDYEVKVDGLTLNYSVLSYVYSAINSNSISNKVKDSVKALYWFYIATKSYADTNS